MESVFFWVSKLAWLIISPDTVLLILILAAWIFLRRGSYHTAGRLLGAVLLVLMMITLFPVGEWILYPLEKRFPVHPEMPETVDGIIVLSGPEDTARSAYWNQVELTDGAERYLAFLQLARQYPRAKLMITGGSGSLINQEYKAADVGKVLIEKQGLDSSRVILERNSRNTYENALFSKKMIKPDSGETWILITTAWHMPRSVGIFCKTGWPVIPYPVDHRTFKGGLFRIKPALAAHLLGVTIGVKEWTGLLAYYITGKTTTLLPDRCYENLS